MIIGHHDTSQKVFLIAEIGNNHEGDFGLAREMIAAAAETGVDAVKFQTFIPEHYVCSRETARLEMLRKFQLSRPQFEQLAEEAKNSGLVFFSTPFDLESAKFLNNIQPVFKIASGDNTFTPLVETVAGFAKPMIISTGLADMPLVERLYADINSIWQKKGATPGLAFLHCVASYPVPPEDANLAAIGTLKERFPGVEIGYSDHTLGIKAGIYSVAAGARIVEKHFTLNKNHSDFRDHQLSADPKEMQELVEAVREVSLMMGRGEKSPRQSESPGLTAMRRSIAAARDIAPGSRLEFGDLTWVRPGTGLAPGLEDRLAGKRTLRALVAGELIQAEDVGE